MVLLGKKQNRRKFGGCADERANFASWKCVFTEFTVMILGKVTKFDCLSFSLGEKSTW
jgi:hypothetical protein